MSLVDRIPTDRLVLRGHTLQDFDALHAMWSELAVYRHIIGRPSTREEAWNRLLRYAGHWELLGYGYWVVEERATGSYVGEMGFADYHRDIDPPLDGRPEFVIYGCDATLRLFVARALERDDTFSVMMLEQ